MSNKFSVEYIKKNFKVKNFCKHLEHLEHLLKKKSDGTNKDILSQPPIYLFVLYSALVNNVEKFNEPIKLTKNSTGKDLESFKAGEKYKVIFSYKEIDKDSYFQPSRVVADSIQAMSIEYNTMVYEMKRKNIDIIVLSLGEAFFDIPLLNFDDLPIPEIYHYSHSRGIP